MRGLLQPGRRAALPHLPDERRDAGLICVVEEPGDVIPIERTHEYRGRYHVLGGALSPIDGIDPEDLKIAELYARVTGPPAPDPPVREVVLATNPTTTGEATALHIAAALRERAPDADGDPPGLGAAGRLRPRVRRRGHAGQGARRPPRALARIRRRSRRRDSVARLDLVLVVAIALPQVRQPHAQRTVL